LIKLVAIDIDGTLLNDKREITPEVKSAIRRAKEKGVKIVITTGRPFHGVKDILAELNLLEDGDYVITFNGALVVRTKDNSEFIRKPLAYEDYLDIERLSRELNVHLHANAADCIYTANRNISKYTVNEAFIVDMPLLYRTPEEMTPNLEIIKCMYIDEPEFLDKVIPQIEERFEDRFTMVRSTPFYYELLNREVSKGQAVIALAIKLGFTQSETMAIGDADNDIAMLEVVGHPVAMGNATENILAVARKVTKSNNEHGVAHAIEQWVL
jgi:Cof subfamily protein (haloacid dehalogenase superfamily)